MRTVHYLLSLQPPDSIVALLMAIPIIFTSAVFHEGAHWVVGRWFGAGSSLIFFPLRGKSKLWMQSVMAVRYDDGAHHGLTRTQIRMIAAAGPGWDLIFGAACVHFYATLPIPVPMQAAVACAGLMIMGTTLLMNVVPRRIGNDGWNFCFPVVTSSNER